MEIDRDALARPGHTAALDEGQAQVGVGRGTAGATYHVPNAIALASSKRCTIVGLPPVVVLVLSGCR